MKISKAQELLAQVGAGKGTSGRWLVTDKELEAFVALIQKESADRFELRKDTPTLSPQDLKIIWESMPGGPQQWLKDFGYSQFGRAVEEVLAAKYASWLAEQGICEREDSVGV